ncbi:hypothetical protein MANES_07G063671v8 [Manihot esculenta]|uniref:Uncharacterized protein n=2 Tax=Manihot esculenta TaxID=3983 RepID=A0ACB7HFF0_MANES|nr:hypothetical protein MANES_07G063671v8 [Manihot esculenta]
MVVGSGWLISGLPIPSLELSRRTWAKAWVSWLLKWRVQRKAGFTEQRLPPASGSGRITGRCYSGLQSLMDGLF